MFFEVDRGYSDYKIEMSKLGFELWWFNGAAWTKVMESRSKTECLNQMRAEEQAMVAVQELLDRRQMN
jgi:hypothetical protein